MPGRCCPKLRSVSFLSSPMTLTNAGPAVPRGDGGKAAGWPCRYPRRAIRRFHQPSGGAASLEDISTDFEALSPIVTPGPGLDPRIGPAILQWPLRPAGDNKKGRVHK